MAAVTIYTRTFCPYCEAAVRLLADKNADVTRIDAGSNEEARAEMIARSAGAKTYPQIFIGEKHIGGFDELSALEAKGELAPMIEA